MTPVLLVSLLLSQTPSLETGRAHAQALYTRDVNTLMRDAGPGLKKQFATPEALGQFIDKVRGNFGDEFRVMGESMVSRGGLTVYRRAAGFTWWARGVEVEFGYDSTGHLALINAQPSVNAVPSPHADEEPQTALRLPFAGVWNVLWGGRTWEDNRHAAVCDQRYALDLLIFRGPQTFTGDPLKNESYFVWGAPVLAPADGTVVSIENRIADNVPTQILLNTIYGNHVVIDHGHGEFSLLGHLQNGSVTVKPGQRVIAGQPIAKTGNSGMSTEPHLHYQLMDHADWKKAHGLPSVFEQFVRNGKVITRGEPLRGDVIAPVPFEASR